MRVLCENSGKPLDSITLRDLMVQCIIGVNPEEKIRTQLLRLDVRIYLDTAPSAFSGNLSRTIDYSLVANQLSFLLSQSRFRLLESAAEALAMFLLSPPVADGPTIHAVDIEIKKPEALGGISVPSVRIFRDRASWMARPRSEGRGRVLFQVPEVLIERLIVPAGETVTLDNHEGLAYLCESSGLEREREPLAAGTVLATRDVLHLVNPQAAPASLIAVTWRGKDRYSQPGPRLH